MTQKIDRKSSRPVNFTPSPADWWIFMRYPTENIFLVVKSFFVIKLRCPIKCKTWSVVLYQYFESKYVSDEGFFHHLKDDIWIMILISSVLSGLVHMLISEQNLYVLFCFMPWIAEYSLVRSLIIHSVPKQNNKSR